MFKNYIKTTLRALWKHKALTAINLVGLSIGIAACLLILEYVNFELSFDRFNVHGADIYRVANDRYQHGKLVQHGTITYSGVGKALLDDFPQVVDHARVEPIPDFVLTIGSKKMKSGGGLCVDNSFLSMFSYDILAGDRKNPLDEPRTAVLTESLAKAMYGVGRNNLSSCIGKAFYMRDDTVPIRVTAVCADVPGNSHLWFNYLLSYTTLISYGWNKADYDFTDSDFWHYILLRKGTDPRVIEAQLPAFSQRHFQGDKISGSDETFHLQPLYRAHLYSDFEYEIGNTGNATVVWGLLAIALIILGIAWVNYVNLATARSIERAREVGIRKVVGALRGQLIRQFLIESIFVNGVSLLGALGLLALAQGAFNGLLGHDLSLHSLFLPGPGGHALAVALGIAFLAGVLASGFYPAFILSGFHPILVLKGKFSQSKKGLWLRKSLVVGQFTVTVTLIIGALIVFRQLRFMNRQELGVNINQVLVVDPPAMTRWDSTFIGRMNSFDRDLMELTHVKSATTSWTVPGGEMPRNFGVRRLEDDSTVHYTMRRMGVGEGFLRTYDIHLCAGRDFESTDFDPDASKVHNILISRLAAKTLGYASPDAAVGKTVLMGDRHWDVVGVFDDYHQKSLRYGMEPTLLQPNYGNNSPVSIRVEARDVQGTIAAIKERYLAFFPGNLFDYFFLDEHFNEQYKDDQLFGKAFTLFAGLGIFVACLGLLGLSMLGVIRRTKEIGVRKVLGASVRNVVLLLSKDLVLLVLLADVISIPLAWLIMHDWVQGFAYRAPIGVGVFVLASLGAVLIAFLAVSLLTIRAAWSNPVNSLRTE